MKSTHCFGARKWLAGSVELLTLYIRRQYVEQINHEKSGKLFALIVTQFCISQLTTWCTY